MCLQNERGTILDGGCMHTFRNTAGLGLGVYVGYVTLYIHFKVLCHHKIDTRSPGFKVLCHQNSHVVSQVSIPSPLPLLGHGRGERGAADAASDVASAAISARVQVAIAVSAHGNSARGTSAHGNSERAPSVCGNSEHGSSARAAVNVAIAVSAR